MYKGIFNDIIDGHPSNTKKGGVCVYYKEYLPLTRRIDICKLIGCIVTEITVSNETSFLACLYRSSSQNPEQFEFFYENQGGLNKKQMQPNLCNIFSIFIFNEFYLLI